MGYRARVRVFVCVEKEGKRQNPPHRMPWGGANFRSVLWPSVTNFFFRLFVLFYYLLVLLFLWSSSIDFSMPEFTRWASLIERWILEMVGLIIGGSRVIEMGEWGSWIFNAKRNCGIRASVLYYSKQFCNLFWIFGKIFVISVEQFSWKSKSNWVSTGDDKVW